MSMFDFLKKPKKKKKRLNFSPKQERRKYDIERSEVKRGAPKKKARSIAVATVKKGEKKNGQKTTSRT